jgi:hypothetical protein
MPTSPRTDSRAVLLTQPCHDALQARLRRLRAEHGAVGTDVGDVVEATGVRNELATLELTLSRAVVAHAHGHRYALAAIGTVVDVVDGDRRSSYRLVLGPEPAEDDGSRSVSAFSPVGAALLGRAVGETVEVALPDMRVRSLRVVGIRAAG